MSKKEQIGYITVDAGVVQVGDPCYGSDYEEIVDDLVKNFNKQIYQLKHETGMEGKGIIVQSGYGDGIYPVYIKRDKNGVVTRLIVEFT